MRVEKLEEILEECVSAHVEGRRSLEESLSLYPGLRSELEPLLRTALRLRGAFQSAAPAAVAQQRGLARFLSDARARRNLKTFRRQGRRGWLTGILAPEHRMGFAATAAVVAVATIAIGIASLGGGDGGRDGVAGNVTTPAPETPALVQNLRTQITAIRDRIDHGQQVEPRDLEQLSQAARDLQDLSAEDMAELQTHVGPVIQDADDLLQTIVSTQPALGATAEAQDAIDATRDVAAVFNVPLPSQTAAATPVATPADTGGATQPPTDVPTAGPTETTAEQNEAPTPTPEGRSLPGFSP